MKDTCSLGRMTLAILVGLMISFGPSWVSAEEQKKEGAGDVQERAVPRMGGAGVLTPKTGALIVQGNQIKAAPGYVLEKGRNNRVAARKAGGGIESAIDCKCEGGTGNCGLSHTDTIAVCSVSPSGPCSGTCKWGDAVKIGGTLQMR